MPKNATADDFLVFHATASDIRALNLALRYIETQMPLFGAPAVARMIETGAAIAINHRGDVSYNSQTHTINWDPNIGLEFLDADGKWNVNSPAINMLHEFAHGMDDNLLANMDSKNVRWKDDAERWAAQYTNSAAQEAGEGQRDIYGNSPGASTQLVNNPTQHSLAVDADSGVWVQVGYDYQIEVGPEYGLGEYLGGAPIFGSGGGEGFKPGDKNFEEHSQENQSITPIELVGIPLPDFGGYF